MIRNLALAIVLALVAIGPATARTLADGSAVGPSPVGPSAIGSNVFHSVISRGGAGPSASNAEAGITSMQTVTSLHAIAIDPHQIQCLFCGGHEGGVGLQPGQ